MDDKKLISIVIPCYNEEKNINRTIDGLLEMANRNGYRIEIIAVNDGSKDKTWEVIREYAKNHSEVVGVNQMTNYGQSAAYQAGFDNAQGEYIVTVSADLEISLDYVKQVIDLLDEGYDFVNTNRIGRWGTEDSGHAAKSGLANKIIEKVSGVKVQDRGSGLKGFRSSLVKQLRLYGDMHRFIPDYLSLYGAKMTEIDVDFRDRDSGVSAYKGSKKTIQVLLDLVTLSFMLYFAKKPFKMMPGRLFGFTGAVISGLGVLLGMYLTFLKILGQSIGGRPLLTLSVLMIIVGVQSMMMGMIGELLLRVYFESSGRKTYSTREVVR